MFLLPHQFVRIMKDIHNKQKRSFLPRCFIDSSPSLFFHIFCCCYTSHIPPPSDRRLRNSISFYNCFTNAHSKRYTFRRSIRPFSVASKWVATCSARRRGTAQTRPKPPTSSSVHHHLQNHERSRETTVSNKTASCGAVLRC